MERVTNHSAIMLSPRQYVPVQFASADVGEDEFAKLDAALIGYGYGGGYRGYGGVGYGWQRWAVSFLIIYALWGLLLW